MSDSDKKKKGVAGPITKTIATGIAAYIAYRMFKKQQSSIHGVLEAVISKAKRR